MEYCLQKFRWLLLCSALRMGVQNGCQASSNLDLCEEGLRDRLTHWRTDVLPWASSEPFLWGFIHIHSLLFSFSSASPHLSTGSLFSARGLWEAGDTVTLNKVWVLSGRRRLCPFTPSSSASNAPPHHNPSGYHLIQLIVTERPLPAGSKAMSWVSREK